MGEEEGKMKFNRGFPLEALHGGWDMMGLNVSALFHGFDDFDSDQDTEAEERADQQKDRSSARIWEELRESDLAFLNQLQISCQ